MPAEITVPFVLLGIGYSAFLIVIIHRVSHDILISSTVRSFLILQAIILPFLGMMIAYFSTTPLTPSKNSNPVVGANDTNSSDFGGSDGSDGSDGCGGE